MLQIRVLGKFSLQVDGTHITFAARPRSLSLLAYLLLERSRPVGRDRLAFTLWPEASESEARANLRRHLYDLGRQLPPAEVPWVTGNSRSVQWNPARRSAFST